VPAILHFNVGSSGATTPSSLIGTFDQGAGVVAGDFVAKNGVSGEVVPADAVALATGRAIGRVTATDTPVPGECQVLLYGLAIGFVGLVPGGVYVLASGTPGAVVLETDTGNPAYPDLTPGSGEVLQAVGQAVTATTMLVNPSTFYTLL